MPPNIHTFHSSPIDRIYPVPTHTLAIVNDPQNFDPKHVTPISITPDIQMLNEYYGLRIRPFVHSASYYNEGTSRLLDDLTLPEHEDVPLTALNTVFPFDKMIDRIGWIGALGVEALLAIHASQPSPEPHPEYVCSTMHQLLTKIHYIEKALQENGKLLGLRCCAFTASPHVQTKPYLFIEPYLRD